MADASTVTVSVTDGPSTRVPWFQGMNAQQALEGAYDAINSSEQFTYALQYFGGQLGYLVVMINETFETFNPSADPNYYWEFLLNGLPSQTGIDATILNPDDAITFELQVYSSETHTATTVGAKHAAKRELATKRS